jgi:hypothetical protein
MRVAIGLLLVSSGIFVIWGSQSLGPTEQAVRALQSNDEVRYIDDNWPVFAPDDAYEVCFIFYPGGRVASTVLTWVRALLE